MDVLNQLGELSLPASLPEVVESEWNFDTCVIS
jgi:hypothetical protein